MDNSHEAFVGVKLSTEFDPMRCLLTQHCSSFLAWVVNLSRFMHWCRDAFIARLELDVGALTLTVPESRFKDQFDDELRQAAIALCDQFA